MNREHIGLTTNGTEVSADRSTGRIYLKDIEGFEQYITTDFLVHGWHDVTTLLVAYYGLSKHRLADQGLPFFYKRRASELQVFKRRAPIVQMFKHR